MTRLSLLIGCLLLSGCAKCLEGHTELRHREAYTSTQLVTLTGLPWMGKGPAISRTTNHPAKDYENFVCDRYEDR